MIKLTMSNRQSEAELSLRSLFLFLFKGPFSRHANISKLPLVIWLIENVVKIKFCNYMLCRLLLPLVSIAKNGLNQSLKQSRR